MPRPVISLLAFSLGCGAPSGGGDTDEPALTCDTQVAAYESALAGVQSCTVATECGQPISGTSCGCTRNRVARLDADLTEVAALQGWLSDAGCDYGATSVCDCPEALGFECLAGECAFNLVERYPGLPACPTPGDPYELTAAVVSGDSLTATVSYGGGCEAHTFDLCWDQGFMESEPVQVSLTLFHEGNDDPCDAWLTEDVLLDLAPLKASWQDAYHSASGTIVLHLDGQTVSYTF